MRKFSLLLISTFALTVSIPDSAFSDDYDCGWVNYCPGKEEEPQCPERMIMSLGLGCMSCVPDSSIPE